jgi:hypothetical protein
MVQVTVTDPPQYAGPVVVLGVEVGEHPSLTLAVVSQVANAASAAI